MTYILLIFLFIIGLTGCGDNGGENRGNPVNPDAGGDAGTPGLGNSQYSASGECFLPGEIPPSNPINGFYMPSVEDEKNAYKAFGWTWTPDAEPTSSIETEFSIGLTGNNEAAIHDAIEGDDVWGNLMMYIRTQHDGYLNRTEKWLNYYLTTYVNSSQFRYDQSSYGLDHLAGWGLLDWYEYTNRMDSQALEAAETIGMEMASLWDEQTTVYDCVALNGCMSYGVRLIGRHLLLATRLAEVTGKQEWEQLRDTIIETLLSSNRWHEDHGFYFIRRGDINNWFQNNHGVVDAYDVNGARIQSPFEVGILTEGMDQAYRSTGDSRLRERIERIAEFVYEYGLDPNFNFTGYRFGVFDNEPYHSTSFQKDPQSNPNFDGTYTTSLVNTLVRGFRYTCNEKFISRAALHFIQGNRAVDSNDPVAENTSDGIISHFVDSQFTSSGRFFAHNKGELQYTYLLFNFSEPE